MWVSVFFYIYMQMPSYTGNDFIGMKNITILFMSVVEVGVCAWLIRSIITRTNPFMAIQTVYSPIRKNVLGEQSNSPLKYYYEFQPGITFTERTYWSEDHSTYTINRDTLNSVRDYDVEKKSNVYRVVTLGDSFTMGFYVDTEHTWPSRLEQLLNQHVSQCRQYAAAEVINLGMGGYDIEYEVERFRLRGQKYNPDLLFWFVSDNDFNDINEHTIGNSQQIQELVKGFVQQTSRKFVEEMNQVWRDAHRMTMDALGRDGMAEYQRQRLFSMRTLFRGRIIIVVDESVSPWVLEILNGFVGSDSNISLLPLRPYARFVDDHPSAEGHMQIANQIDEYVKIELSGLCRE